MAQVDWLGLGVGGHPALSLHSSNELGTIRYDTRCYFNVRSKADMSQLNLLHG